MTNLDYGFWKMSTLELPGEKTLNRPSCSKRSEERRVGKEWRSLCDWSSDVCSSDLIWCDTTHNPPYVLMLLSNQGELYQIIDPRDKYRIIRSGGYDELRLWLLEDEYTRVTGRENFE